MATIKNSQNALPDQDEDLKGPKTASFASSSGQGANAIGAAPANEAAKPGSGAFTNVQSFLNANNPQGISQKVASTGQKQAQKTNQELNKQKTQLNQDVSDTQAAINTASSNFQNVLSGTAATGGNEQELQNLTGSYNQLQNAQTGVGLGGQEKLQAGASSINQLAKNLVGGKGGQQNALRSIYGQQRPMTAGGLDLDQTLLGASGADFSGVRRQAAQVQRGIDQAGKGAQAESANLANTLEGAKSQAAQNVQGEIATQRASQQQQASQMQNDFASISEMLSGKKPADAALLSKYGVGNAELSGTSAADFKAQADKLASSFGGNLSATEKAQLLDPKQRARLSALGNIVKDQSLISDLGTAGTGTIASDRLDESVVDPMKQAARTAQESNNLSIEQQLSGLAPQMNKAAQDAQYAKQYADMINFGISNGSGGTYQDEQGNSITEQQAQQQANAKAAATRQAQEALIAQQAGLQGSKQNLSTKTLLDFLAGK